MFIKHLFRAPRGAPFLLLLCLCGLPAARAEAPRLQVVEASDLRAAHEALVEAIESEGLVVGGVLPFGEMLARTADDPADPGPYREAEIVQFCSAGLARAMVAEDPAQITECPLAVAVYVLRTRPGQVVYAYRSPGAATPARRQAGDLLERLVTRAAALARLRW